MRYALALSLVLTGCPMVTPSGPTDAGQAPADAGVTSRDSGPEPSEACPQELPAPAAGQDCLIEGSGEARLIGGDLLLDDGMLENGWVLIASSGDIACVGCDCADQAQGAVTISCPDVVVSPAYIVHI